MRIDGTTELYGIMGKPVAHSLSPAMHNKAFGHLGLNKVYVPFPVRDVRPAMEGFRALQVRGVSVTIPHKQAVIPFLDAIDPVAEKIGAVNTLVISDDRIKGYNTDWLGANMALEHICKLADSDVLVLGAGGSARAIGFGLQERGARVILASRTPTRGRNLAFELGCPWHPLAEIEDLEVDALVNATSVGMHPQADAMPVAAEVLKKIPAVMDIVYAPLETRLLREARQAGCKTIDGTYMLLYQGAAQFELWHDIPAPVDVMQKELLSLLNTNS